MLGSSGAEILIEVAIEFDVLWNVVNGREASLRTFKVLQMFAMY